MSKANILIIDDEIEFSAVVAERLRTRGFDVDTAAGGKAGLILVQKKNFDAVLLDLAMPEMDGIDVLKMLLEYDHNLQIIMLTGHGTVQKGVEAIKLGAMDFLEKPADLADLIGKVTQAQENRMRLFEEELDQKMMNLLRKKAW